MNAPSRRARPGTRGRRAACFAPMRIAFALLALLPIAHAWAAAPITVARIKPMAELSREVWTTRNGLPHNQVNAIRQTPDGYLWFATWEGVARYNGVGFRVFDRSNTPALSDNGARSLHVMRDGGVLIGTSRGGVTKVDARGRWRTWSTAHGLVSNEVMSAIEDRRGRIWVATESQGVDRLDAHGVKHFGRADGLLSEIEFDLAEGSDGAIWVASALGVNRIVEDKVEVLAEDAGLPATNVNDIEVAADGAVWVATQVGGFVRRSGSARFERITAEDLGEVTTKVLPEATDRALFGTVNEGVIALAGVNVDRFHNLRNLPNNRVTALFRDREDSIWVGTSAGVLRLRDTPFSTWTTDHGLPDDYVRTLVEDSEGTLWIGTSRGLASVPAGSSEPFAAAPGLPTESILGMTPARDGGVWIGTYADGLIRYRDGAVVQRWKDTDGLAHNQVRAVLETRDGTVWVGTSLGLSRIRGAEVVSLGLASGLPREFVMALAESRDGRIWVGTANGIGISTEDGFRTLELPPGLEAQDIFGFHEDERGIMWVASDRGLLRVENDQVVAIGLEQGLPIDGLFAVAADSLENLWLSSNRGVMRLARADADAVAAGVRRRLEVEQFGEHDGLISAQCNGGASPAAAVTADGRIWIATAHGVAFVRPNELARFAHEPPKAVIEEVRIDDVRVDNRGAVALTPGQRKIEIQYAALSFLTPERIRYRYVLEGLDEKWSVRGEGRSAQFTNLKPGNYRFRVAAMFPGGGWSRQEAMLPISVEQVWWKRTSIMLPLASALLIALWLAYRARMLSLARDAAHLVALVERRTKDLRTQTALLKAADSDKTALLARLRTQSEDFERQAREDSLTGLHNRRSADAFLEAASARADLDLTPLTLVLIDLDNFKSVNDRYSHAIGDAALRAVAEVLRRHAREGDLAARWGGEEFVLVLPGVDLDGARAIAERMRAAVASLDLSATAEGLALTLSAGVAEHVRGESGSRLVSRADDQLYTAKRNGRNRVEA